jgi:hypothetical protein
MPATIDATRARVVIPDLRASLPCSFRTDHAFTRVVVGRSSRRPPRPRRARYRRQIRREPGPHLGTEPCPEPSLRPLPRGSRPLEPPPAARRECPAHLASVGPRPCANPAPTLQGPKRAGQRRTVEREQLAQRPLGTRSRERDRLEQRVLRRRQAGPLERRLIAARHRARRAPEVRAGARQRGHALSYHGPAAGRRTRGSQGIAARGTSARC